MKKSNAIITLLVFLAVLAGVTFIDVKGIDGNGKVAASDITLGLDLAGGVSITYEVVGDEEPSATDLADTKRKLEERVYNYSNEAQVYLEGNDRINVEIPGVTDANAILEELGNPGTLYFLTQKGSDGNDNYSQTIVQDEDGNASLAYVLNRSIDEIVADGCVVLNGSDIKSAEAVPYQDSQTGNTSSYCIDLLLNDEGRQKFANATTSAYQNGETIAIYYDGKVICAPTVNGALTDGRAQISGNYTYEDAEKLASLIRIGGLKLELNEIHSKVVGAQLGSDAIKTSLEAGAIGLAVIAVFMIGVYFLPGFVASIALLLYTALIVLLLNGFDITLTLPGIAGIILSIGMAVDANVIIFARIREELATGKTVKSSEKIGFDKALSAILDGNITTLIAALVLLIFGSGSIKGFAQTLILGIVLSMFTALFVTRWLLRAFYAIGFTSEKWYGVGKEHKALDFVGKRWVYFAISLVLIVGGFVMMGVNKAQTGNPLNLSLDFVGGTSMTVTFNEQKSLSELETDVIPEMEKIAGSAVQPQPVQNSTDVVFKTNALDVTKRDAIEEMLLDKYGVENEQIVMETIGGTISKETTVKTFASVCVAMVCMLIYIAIRFKNISFGAGGVLALLHDVLVVLAFYAAAKVSVGSTFIACMLTLVGYSINATIVVYDRIRENRSQMGSGADLKDVINRSITQTLSRSIFTSLTTFIMVAALYVLGVTAIREFALPLMVGIACGTYSSVFLAGSMYYMMQKNKKAVSK
ncbi:MAG: protein translocase subunit SecD [Lachnospiraceae bacterium]|nr:protein translocase subunit SecD [Clostridium sp.]MDD6179825.1 protein translocase subunit SecD [Clostridium sp.]MDY4821066.1 protein translocase subunit SecD [Lachnospiraceae bacterium]